MPSTQKKLKLIPDEQGRLLEILRKDDPDYLPMVAFTGGMQPY